MTIDKTLEAYFAKPDAKEREYMTKRKASQPTAKECRAHDHRRIIKMEMTRNRPPGDKK